MVTVEADQVYDWREGVEARGEAEEARGEGSNNWVSGEIRRALSTHSVGRKDPSSLDQLRKYVGAAGQEWRL